jgi:hypothetical protein
LSLVARPLCAEEGRHVPVDAKTFAPTAFGRIQAR